MEIAGQDAELPEIRRRSRYFALVAMIAFLTIAGRLFYLQVIQGDTLLPRHLRQHRAHRALAGGARTDSRPQGQGAGHGAAVVQRLRDAAAAHRRGVRAPAGPPRHERRRGDRCLGARPERWRRRGRRASGAAGRGHLARGDGGDRDRRRSPGRQDRLGAAPVVPDGGAGRARPRLHERDLRRRAARQEGRGLPRRRPHRPDRDRAAVGRLPARARRLPEDRGRPARDAQDRHPRHHRRAGGAAGRGGEQRRAHHRRRPAALHRAGAAQRLGGRAWWRSTSTAAGSWRWPPSRASTPTRCRGT